MNHVLLKVSLVKHEGVRLMPYRDSMGNLTIGVGRNLIAKGISQAEAGVLLDNDIAEVEAALSIQPWWGKLNDVRQRVVAEMAFNVGIAALLPPGDAFYKMLAAIENNDFDKAAAEMIDSHWSQQVGHRAVELADAMRSGI